MFYFAIFFSFLGLHFPTQAEELPLSQLQNAILVHELAVDFHTWNESQYNPTQIFQTLQKNVTSKDKNQICEYLKNISREDLLLFYSAIEEDKILLNPRCRQTLLSHINEYLEASKVIQTTTLFGSSFYSPQLSLSTDTLTRIETVETKGGKVFWYGEHGDLNRKEIALTFDDGPHSSLTEKLLTILNNHNIKATFFVLGKNVRHYPNILREIERDGHTIANHTFNHKNLPKYSSAFGEREIDTGFEAIIDHIGRSAPFFRFPYGAKTRHLSAYLKKHDMPSFFWDIDTLDWKKKNPTTLLNFALDEVNKMKGGIALFHDIQPQTIAMMDAFITQLKIQGYTFVVYKPNEWLSGY